MKTQGKIGKIKVKFMKTQGKHRKFQKTPDKFRKTQGKIRKTVTKHNSRAFPALVGIQVKIRVPCPAGQVHAHLLYQHVLHLLPVIPDSIPATPCQLIALILSHTMFIVTAYATPCETGSSGDTADKWRV